MRHHFGARPTRLVEQKGGLTNSVWTMTVAGDRYVVRTHEDATQLERYRKEHWAMDAARAAGVATPRVFEVGLADDRPFMIAEYVNGTDARHAKDRHAMLELLGATAARLHTVRTHGFGESFDWSMNVLSRHDAWRDWLAHGFDVERRLDALLRRRMIDAPAANRLRTIARAMGRWNRRPVLHHGDLRLKNMLVDESSTRLVALIDWEDAVSAPAPHWDLAIALHDLGIDEKEAFLAGYDIAPRTYADALPFIRFFNVLNYADEVDRATRAKDRPRLALLRLRLSGALDLHSI